MKYLVMITTLMFMQQGGLSREAFNMIDSPAKVDIVPKTIINPGIEVEIGKKVKELSYRYRNSSAEYRAKVIMDKTLEWFYSLPENKNDSTVAKRNEVERIVKEELKIRDAIRAKVKSNSY